MINLLLLGLLTFQLELEPIEGYFQGNYLSWYSGYLTVSDEGFLINLRDKIHLYDHNGHMRKIFDRGLEAHGMAILRNHLILTGLRNENEWVTLSVDLASSEEKLIAGDFRTLQVVEDELFGSSFDERVAKGKYPRIFQRIDPITLATSEPMLKAPHAVISNLSYKFFWIARSGDALVFVNQIENRAYFSTEKVRNLESRLSGAIKGITPYLELDLERKVQLEPNFQLPGFDSREKNMLRWIQRRLRYSFNLFFSNFGDGYVICYEVPDKLDGLYVGNHLGIQFLDEKLRPQGSLIERFGQIMGVHRDAVYVFYPSGRIGVPDGEASVRAHYKLPKIENTKDLSQVIEQIQTNTLQQARIKPVVELISPP
jgi:hypothetical protein